MLSWLIWAVGVWVVIAVVLKVLNGYQYDTETKVLVLTLGVIDFFYFLQMISKFNL